MNLAVIIPAFNEEASIKALILKIRPIGFPIIVDDCSTDATREISRESGGHVVHHSINQGYEAALETGITEARMLGFSHAVTMDADGQHSPDLLNIFIKEFQSGADVIVGNRNNTQRWSEYIFRIVGSMIWGINDPLCGMKGYRLDMLDGIESFRTYKSIGTELVLRLAKKDIKISQPKISIIPRSGESRFGSGLAANLSILAAIFFSVVRLR